MVKILEKNRNNNEFHKEYVALVHGTIPIDKARGCITYPLAKRTAPSGVYMSGKEDGSAYSTQKSAFEVKVCRPCYDTLRATGGKHVSGGVTPIDPLPGNVLVPGSKTSHVMTPADATGGSAGANGSSPNEQQGGGSGGNYQGKRVGKYALKKGMRENPACPNNISSAGWKCQGGVVAKTFFQAISYYNGVDADGQQQSYTLMGIKIISGQTHQIRVHMKDFCEWECGIKSGRAGIVGDAKYMPKWASDADRKAGFPTHFLHAFKLGVPRISDSLNETGRKGKRDNFLAPLPQSWLKYVQDKLFWDNTLNDALKTSPLKPNFIRENASERDIPVFLKGHRDYQMNWDWTAGADCRHY